jgi:hypothetical protein
MFKTQFKPLAPARAAEAGLNELNKKLKGFD